MSIMNFFKKEEEDYFSKLERDGVVVIPMFENPAEELGKFLDALCSSPEFENATPKTTFSLGGMGYTPAASFAHHPAVRKYTTVLTQKMIDYLIIPGYLNQNPNLKFAVTWDRAAVRQPWQIPSGSMYHQDKSPSKDHGDKVIGGWVGFSGAPQYFMCIPGSHKPDHELFSQLSSDNFDGKIGFAKWSDKEDQAKVKLYAKKNNIKPVMIPPGHAVLFHENIIHTVFNNPYPVGENGEKSAMVRQHFTCYFTENPVPLMNRPIAADSGAESGGMKRKKEIPLGMSLEEMFATQAFPVIKSQQQSPVYSRAHVVFHPEKIEEISKNFAKECLDPRNGRVRRILPSLKQLSEMNPERFQMFPPYSPEEMGVFYPSRSFRFADGSSYDF